jgi:PAS domain S-box-containing protein
MKGREEKQAKEEIAGIQRLHTRLRSIIDAMRHVVISFSYGEEEDGQSATDFSFYDRHLVEINPAAEALYGVPKEDFLTRKRSIFDFLFEKDREKVLAHYNNLLEEGIGELTYRVIGPLNEVRWVLDYGRVEYLERGRARRATHILEDITREKKALDELKASEEKYRRIFEHSKDMVYVVTPEGDFIDINQAGVDLLGLSGRKEAVARNIKEFYVDPSQRETLMRELMEKGEVTRSRVILKNAAGGEIEVDLSLIARRDESGSIRSYQGIVHNITEAMRQKELESIGRLAGCFADDLASPLSVNLMDVSMTRDFLAGIREDMQRLSIPDGVDHLGEIVAEIRRKLAEAEFFIGEAVNAGKDMKARLEEIRDQYWSLTKVPDGAGGLIYQRVSKGKKGIAER